jgi:hypothetical protein
LVAAVERRTTADSDAATPAIRQPANHTTRSQDQRLCATIDSLRLAPGLRRTSLNTAAATSGGDPAEGAADAVRLALLPDGGPTAGFYDWTGTPQPW